MNVPPAHVDNLLQTTYINRVPDIYIELPKYKFFHSPNPLDHKNQDDRFIGREDLLKKLKLILTHSDTKAGAYLITGFRGMGKTSVVRRAIAEINRDAKNEKYYKYKRYEPIEISLAQDDLKEIDVFRLISRHLLSLWEKEGKYSWYKQLGFKRNQMLRNRFNSIKEKIEELNIRINAELSVEKGQFNNLEPKIGYLGLEGQVGTIRNSENRVTAFPIAGAKEIEWILITILNDIQEYRALEIKKYKKKGPDMLFIFDELDKIEPYQRSSIEEKETENPHFDEKVFAGGPDKVRRRRETIAQLLANLKNFLNVAQAKFIFIGGREMYDASLADIADRDSFYSSIFHDILYVDSFLKDQAGQYAKGITQMTEMYLSKILIPKPFIATHGGYKDSDKKELRFAEDHVFSLRTYFGFLCELFSKPGTDCGTFFFYPRSKEAKNSRTTPEESFEVDRQYTIHQLRNFIFLLQNFIIYLVYRSNGTPKKLTGLCEDFMVRGSEKEVKNPYNLVIGSKWGEEKDGKRKDGPPEDRVFLRFTAQHQYEINLISIIYRPYLITQSRHLKFLGDKLLFSTSFIIDHIFKFHSFGFSWRNLELIPEIITINKAPQLRSFIQSLIQQYSKTFIRTATGGLFQYKFRNKAANEMRFISKISELSSAAFNFTLDESLYIKRHYYKKLTSLKKNYKLFPAKGEQSGYIHSVGFVHVILGDLHFYDKEYDDAIIQYTDGIQLLRSSKWEELTGHQTVLLIEKKLKLGLTLEKIQSYNTAFAIYESLVEDIPKLLKRSALDSQWYSGAAPKSQFQTVKLLSQPFVAFLHIFEKLRRGGITDTDLRRSEKKFLTEMVGHDREEIDLSEIPHQENRGTSQNEFKGLVNLLVANYYGNIGSVLYYKNKNFSFVIGKLGFYSPLFRELLRKSRGAHFSEGEYNNEEYDQAFYAMLQRLCKKNQRDYNPSFSAYVNYMDSVRWFLIRYDSELAPVRDYILTHHSRYEKYDGVVNSNGKVHNKFLFDILLILFGPIQRTINSLHLYFLGNLLSKVGDTIITFISDDLNIPLNQELFELLFDEEKYAHLDMKIEERISRAYKLIQQESKGLSIDTMGRPIDKKVKYYYSMNLAVFTYRLAAEFFRKAGKPHSFGFQYKKILHISKEYISLKSRKYQEGVEDDFAFHPDFLLFLKDQISVEIIKAITWENSTANRPQILKYKDIFRLQRTMPSEVTQAIYTNISTSPEIWEVILLVSEIQVKLAKLGVIRLLDLDLRLNYKSKSPYISSGSQFVKILECKYKSELNFLYLQKWGIVEVLEQWKETNGGNGTSNQYTMDNFHQVLEAQVVEAYRRKYDRGKESLLEEIHEAFQDSELEAQRDEKGFIAAVVEYLITDSIYSLAELTNILNLYELNYMTNNSLFGFVHLKLAKWSSCYRTILRVQKGEDPEKSIFKKLEKILGWDFLYYLDIRYHYDLALQYYYYAMQMHKEGEAYKNLSHYMYFLEDDFNGNLYHFCAAMERYNLNTGRLREIIDRLKVEIEGDKNRNIPGSKLYRYESYVGQG